MPTSAAPATIRSVVIVPESPNLLLVEDENLIALALADELVSAGYEVVTANDGDVALDELRADAARFRAVVTDVRLGAGADGWVVARTARELSPSIAVVYMSGDSAIGWAANVFLRVSCLPSLSRPLS